MTRRRLTHAARKRRKARLRYVLAAIVVMSILPYAYQVFHYASNYVSPECEWAMARVMSIEGKTETTRKGN